MKYDLSVKIFISSYYSLYILFLNLYSYTHRRKQILFLSNLCQIYLRDFTSLRKTFSSLDNNWVTLYNFVTFITQIFQITTLLIMLYYPSLYSSYI